MTFQSYESARILRKETAIAVVGAIILGSLVLGSCGQNDNERKELELRERELVLREKEFALKKNHSQRNDSMGQNAPTSTSATEVVAKAASTTSYNYERHSNLQVFWRDLQKAIANKDKKAIAEMTNFPFLDFNALPYGRNGLTSKRDNDFSNRFESIFPGCSRSEIVRGTPVNAAEITAEESQAGVTHQLFLGSLCGGSQTPYLAGYAFGRVNGKYRLLGLLYTP